MMYLFDDSLGHSVLRDCKNWEAAEATAKEQNLTLIGEFVSWVDEETGEETYVH